MIKHLLKLFILGQSPLSRRAVNNLNALYAKPEINKAFTIKIIDLYQMPEYAEQEMILATPLLIIEKPPVHRRIIGDLANTARVMEAMGLEFNDDES